MVIGCSFSPADGAATVIQRRQDGSVDFDQTWRNYEEGFGNFKGELTVHIVVVCLVN